MDVWKRSARLSAEIYRQTATLKDFGYRDQLTRSALSIASNIAEGFERGSKKDRAKFLDYAKGSSGEVRTQVYIGYRAGFIPADKAKQWTEETKAISKMLHSLITKVRGL